MWLAKILSGGILRHFGDRKMNATVDAAAHGDWRDGILKTCL
jgi:hypothetical protein